MWLLYGADERWAGAFRDRGHYERMWTLYRDRLLAGCAPGRRPIAWWHCEGPLEGKYAGFNAERRVLFELNLLEPQERDDLIASWRQDFARGWTWSDVPPGLWAEWETQRRDEDAAKHCAEIGTEFPVPAA
jgi:hypothetical protein